MPTYAITGATGQVGSSVLDTLLQSSSNKINAFVRSKQKLLGMRPILANNPNVTIFEGQLTDTTTLVRCIDNAHAIFACAAAVDNIPNCSIAQEQALALLAALEQTKTKNPPKLVILSSASLEPSLMTDLPGPFKAILETAASNVYEDLRLAETYLRANAPSGLELVFIKPGGLVHDKPVGHALSTTHQKTFLSFADLGAGMVEVADSEAGKWQAARGNVSVVPAREGTKIEWYVPWFFLRGCLWHFFPWLHPYLANVLP